MDYGWALLLGVIVVLVFYLGLCGLVGSAARRRGRSSGVFVLLSVLITPLLAYIVLLIIGRLGGRTVP
jgi:hypothetical protein